MGFIACNCCVAVALADALTIAQRHRETQCICTCYRTGGGAGVDKPAAHDSLVRGEEQQLQGARSSWLG